MLCIHTKFDNFGSMDLSDFDRYTLQCMEEYTGPSNYFFSVFYNMPDVLTRYHHLPREQEIIVIDYCVQGWNLLATYPYEDRRVLHERLKTLRDTYDERLRATPPHCSLSIRNVIDGYVLGDLFQFGAPDA